MTLTVGLALLREGSSDDLLIPHLADLVVRAGADEAIGTPRDYGGSVAAKLRALASEKSRLDLIFVHRDADDHDDSERRREIAAAQAGERLGAAVVPVVPVQELEAWLLVDHSEIRNVVGRPHSVVPLDLPALRLIEDTRNPKEVLAEALVVASETAGRRREKEKKRFYQRRRALLERLDIDGPVRHLSSWSKLESDINAAVAGMTR